MTHPQGPFKSLLGPKPAQALPAPASFQLPGASTARGFYFDPSDIDDKKLI